MTDTDLARRLEKLERDNRRFKRLGIAALALAASLGALYAIFVARRPPAGPANGAQSFPQRFIPDNITAREFDIVDSSGMVRISLSVNKDGGAEIALLSNDGKGSAIVGVDGGNLLGGGFVQVSDSQGDFATTFARWGYSAIDLGGAAPFVGLSDAQGFTMDLGSTDTRTIATGETQKTSAASIVMFGNDKKHHVIWQAP